MLELNKEYTYSQICEILGWEQKAGNSKKAQLKEIESAYEFYHPENQKSHKPKKSYIFTSKIRDIIKPSKVNSAGNNTKNIQPMIDYLQAKFDLDSDWYSFTDWYCTKLELMNKGICNAPYHDDEVDAVCEEYNISDGKLFTEYVSAAKSELKNMFLKSLSHMQKKDMVTYFDEIKFIYQLGKRTLGDVITDCINDTVKEIETIVCNDMNEEHNLTQKMKGRQLLKIIYGKKKLTEEFNEFRVMYLNDYLNDNADLLKKLNDELSCQHSTYLPEHCSICSEREILDYRRGIRITDMELSNGDIDALALDITNRIRTKVRKSLRKSYRKFMKQTDIEAIEKALFQHYDANFDDGFLYLAEDDISDIEQIFGGNDNWGEPIDFSVEEILDMPVLGEVQPDLANEDFEEQDEPYKENRTPTSVQYKQGLPNLVKAEPKDNYVTQKDVELIDIASLFTDEEYADLY